jgi:hypothetical protein
VSSASVSGILIEMVRHSKFAHLLWLLAFALLPVRMANAHLHLCADGMEPPVSLHVKDAPTHWGKDHVQEEGHTDKDVDLSSSFVAKHFAQDDYSPALLDAYVLAILLPIQRQIAASSALVVPDLTPVLSLRPPVRGPPSPARL